jgi:hypothetical protein
MNHAIDLLFKARQEIFEGWKWYEEQEAGLGDRFDDEVFRKIGLIDANPLQYPLKKRAREVIADKFPYLIV